MTSSFHVKRMNLWMRHTFPSKYEAWIRAKEFWFCSFLEFCSSSKYKNACDRGYLVVSLWLVHRRCNIWPRGHTREAPVEIDVRDPRCSGEMDGRVRVRVLVRLQRRKHNLIIMYGHISRMSLCLGQCTRGWCSVLTRFWHGGGVHADIPGGLGVSGDRHDNSLAAIISVQPSRPCAIHVLIILNLVWFLWSFPGKFL